MTEQRRLATDKVMNKRFRHVRAGSIASSYVVEMSG
jgi:hypothetical protein